MGAVGAVIAYLGGGAIIVGAFSGWLGKLWADRLMKREVVKHQATIEAMKAELSRRAEHYKAGLRKSEFLFQREYEAVNALVSMVSKLRSQHGDPYMDDISVFYESIIRGFEGTRATIGEFLAQHSAILPRDTRTLISDAEVAATLGSYGDVNGRSQMDCAEELYAKLTTAEEQMISRLRDQAVD